MRHSLRNISCSRAKGGALMASVDRQRGLDTSEGHRTRECEWYEVPKRK